MRIVNVAFPDDPAIDEAYRGRTAEVAYEIKIGESGMTETSIYVNGQEIRGYTARWVLDYVRQGRPLEELAENVDVSGRRKRSAWPADHQWD